MKKSRYAQASPRSGSTIIMIMIVTSHFQVSFNRISRIILHLLLRWIAVFYPSNSATKPFHSLRSHIITIVHDHIHKHNNLKSSISSTIFAFPSNTLPLTMSSTLTCYCRQTTDAARRDRPYHLTATATSTAPSAIMDPLVSRDDRRMNAVRIIDPGECGHILFLTSITMPQTQASDI